jgi:hypothetical protein
VHVREREVTKRTGWQGRARDSALLRLRPALGSPYRRKNWFHVTALASCCERPFLLFGILVFLVSTRKIPFPMSTFSQLDSVQKGVFQGVRTEIFTAYPNRKGFTSKNNFAFQGVGLHLPILSAYETFVTVYYVATHHAEHALVLGLVYT